MTAYDSMRRHDRAQPRHVVDLPDFERRAGPLSRGRVAGAEIVVDHHVLPGGAQRFTAWLPM
jgi:hypothetical protein